MKSTSNASAAALEERFGRALTARLSAGSQDMPHDISERLRAGRMQALARRKSVQVRTAPAVVGVSGGAALLGGHTAWWTRLATVVPLVALVAGLVTISVWQEEDRTAEVADVDAALLTDTLPPAAFTDPGFAQFLKRENAAR